jgi:uncharacterized protein
MTSADVHGKFLWHELMTTDPNGAGSFYTKVLGWKPQPWDKDPAYTVLLADKGPAGGAMQLPSGTTSSPQWLAYVGTPDIGATVAAAERLGGRVVKGATDIPDGGKYAILADPQGATFGIYSPAGDGSGPTNSEFAWHELATSDYEAAFGFYQALFGWEKLGLHDMGPGMGKYLLFGRGGQQTGGMFKRPASMAESWPSWLLYASVPSASKAADAAKAAGGRVVNGPMQVPGGGWIAQLIDPQGAAIAVHQMPAPAAATPKPAKSAAKPTAATPKAAAPASASAGRPKRRAAPKKAKKTPVKKAAAKKAVKAKSKSTKRRAPARAKKKAAKRPAVRRGAAKKKKSASPRRKR